MKNGFRYFCWSYTVLLLSGSAIGLLIGITTEYGGRAPIGCNFYDALFIGIECRGFGGAKAVEFLVGLPLLIGQLSAMAIMSPGNPPAFCLLALLAWLPLFFTLYWLLRRLLLQSKGATSGTHLK